ncbi:MAG: ADP-glyceromanno-heptose 6-epimerase [Bacteroidales bacterium]|jgi:ADP-L-glycero-D-manno-heptose 6-epimerase
MSYIVVTGAVGFIGSALIGKLNSASDKKIIAVDDFSREDKNKNIKNKNLHQKVHRDDFFSWLDENQQNIEAIYHIGARTDTTEFDKSVFDRLNLNYTKQVWQKCSKYQIPLVYASSAATYGMGELGYNDSHDIVDKLKPLNPYGESKNDFDKWALSQTETPPAWYGLKFFNVYGPNEYHKGRMASVVMHSYNQIKKQGYTNLFKSHNPNYKDGYQKRDFVYIKDVVDVLTFLMETRPKSGLYNLGTGNARPFLHLAQAVFKALDIPENINFIDTPIDIRDKYQYFTQADMNKLINEAGYKTPFTSLEDGVADYVTNYLVNNDYL